MRPAVRRNLRECEESNFGEHNADRPAPRACSLATANVTGIGGGHSGTTANY